MTQLNGDPAASRFVKIVRATCPNCGDKAAMVHKGQRQQIPFAMDLSLAERTPTICECRRVVKIEAEEIDPDEIE